MKPDPLDTAVVSHRMDDRAIQQQLSNHNSKDPEASPTDTHSVRSLRSSGSQSPRNSDVVFESWDMVCMIAMLGFLLRIRNQVEISYSLIECAVYWLVKLISD